MNVIELNHVWKTYQTGKVSFDALRDISLSIKKGEYVSIMGPSGSGKSTLMHMMGCLDRPTRGTVLLNGRDITKMDDNELSKARGKSIGFVFQQFNLIRRLSALDNVKLPMWFQEAPTDKRDKRAREVLKAVGLSGKERNRPSELSGGQQQKVAIARALANEPDIILADEPTGNLDSKSGKEVIELLESLNRKGKTLVIVTHDPLIGKRAKRMVKIKDGKIVSDRRLRK